MNLDHSATTVRNSRNRIRFFIISDMAAQPDARCRVIARPKIQNPTKRLHTTNAHTHIQVDMEAIEWTEATGRNHPSPRWKDHVNHLDEVLVDSIIESLMFERPLRLCGYIVLIVYALFVCALDEWFAIGVSENHAVCYTIIVPMIVGIHFDLIYVSLLVCDATQTIGRMCLTGQTGTLWHASQKSRSKFSIVFQLEHTFTNYGSIICSCGVVSMLPLPTQNYCRADDIIGARAMQSGKKGLQHTNGSTRIRYFARTHTQNTHRCNLLCNPSSKSAQLVLHCTLRL